MTRIVRIYSDTPLAVNQAVTLQEDASHHVRTVLRMQVGESIVLFNGDGHDYYGELTAMDKKSVQVHVVHHEIRHTTSSLNTHLFQGVCRGEKMDWVIQKATELGVHSITPILTEFCNVNLKQDRLDKKQQHWQQIAVSACEQSGRTQLVTINSIKTFTEVMSHLPANSVILDPSATASFKNYLVKPISELGLLIGPEGGFSETELNYARTHSVQSVLLGPRILRSETAGLVALSLAQAYQGDF